MKRPLIPCFALFLACACSTPEPSRSPEQLVRRFVDTWANPTGTEFRALSDEGRVPLETAIRSLRATGVSEFSLSSTRVVGERVEGALGLLFLDGAVLTTSVSAQVRSGRVRVSPSIISNDLATWESLTIEEFGAPLRGIMTSRNGTPLISKSDRSAIRADLATAVALVERMLEPRLSGWKGRSLRAGAQGIELGRVEVMDGQDATTSVDLDLQARAADVLGSRPGALVVIDPRTGGIRALVSNPHPRMPTTSSATEPHLPGSTFKIVTAVAAAKAGALNPGDLVDCPGRITIANHTIHNFEDEVGGRITIREAFARSCNTAFARIGSALGFERITSAASDLGLTGPSDAGDRPSRISVPGSEAEVATLAIGASTVSATPIAMAGVAATIAQGGMLVEPRWDEKDIPPRRAIDAARARTVLGLMEQVVESGTGRAARIEGITLAGKTGTAEVQGPDGGVIGNDAWFLAIAPSRPARLVVVCYLPLGGVGGREAAPVVKKFLLSTQTSWR